MRFLHVTSHSDQSGLHYIPIYTETGSPIPEKNGQNLRNSKLTPKASATPSNLTTLAENTIGKPETEAGTKPSREIKLCLSINVWCLAQTNQTSSQNAKQNPRTKLTILLAPFLKSLKTETDSQNHSSKTKPLHRVTPTPTSETQEAKTCKTHEKERERPERVSQAEACAPSKQAWPTAS
ncbi:hypothetical protein G9A89_023357 [Geosiphon pyriformis]|nr:hypothetical protein G9A89_023357 [Geosiphon pyriformis]